MGFNLNDIEGLDKLQDGLKQVVQTGVNEINRGLDRINNPEEAKKNKEANVPDVCPYCGAKLPKDSEADVIKCEYCGAQFDNSSTGSIVDSVFDFVEKQQKIAMDAKQKDMESARVKAQLKAEKRAERMERKKRANRRNFFLLIIIILILAYCYSHGMLNPFINQLEPVISQFM